MLTNPVIWHGVFLITGYSLLFLGGYNLIPRPWLAGFLLGWGILFIYWS